MGPRRLEVAEENTLVDEYYPLFTASAEPSDSERRAVSIGPGFREQDELHANRGRNRAASVMPMRETSVDGRYSRFHHHRRASPTGSRTDLHVNLSNGADEDRGRSRVRTPVETLPNGNGNNAEIEPPSNEEIPTDDPPTFEESVHATPNIIRTANASLMNSRSSSFDPRLSPSAHEPIASTSRVSSPPESTDVPAHHPTEPAKPERHARFNLSKLRASSKPPPDPSKRPQSPSRLPAVNSRTLEEEIDHGQTRSMSRGRKTGLKALREALVSANTEEDKKDADEGEPTGGVGYKLFKAGHYTWPILIPIPTTLPPSITCHFGTVAYALKATVHRHGALTTNLTSETPVLLVSCPSAEDQEENDAIVVERFWEEQMRYLIAINGKAFPMSTTIPLTIRLNPFAKVKIYRLSVILEEKISYHAQNRKITRSEGVKSYTLVKVEYPDPDQFILPILSDDPDAISKSPLSKFLINTTSNDGKFYNAFASLRRTNHDCFADTTPSCLDPIGPWELEGLLQVPNCASNLLFSNNHPAANLDVVHTLKIVLRVERGDNQVVDSKGKNKVNFYLSFIV